MDTSVRRGDIFYADLSPVVGSEQGGVRPVLIIQNDMGNRHSPTVIAAAITSQLNKAKLPTHIELLDPHCGLTKDSVVLLEQIRTLDKRAASGTDGTAGRGEDGSGGHRHRRQLRPALPHPRGLSRRKPVLEAATPALSGVAVVMGAEQNRRSNLLRLFGQEPLTWRCSSWSSEFCCWWWSWCCRRP